jgi:citrate synthase
MNNNPSFPHDDNILARFFGRSSNYTDIPNQLFKEHNVKKGLRNEDGTGVRVGLTKVCDVIGYTKDEEGNVIPCEGDLIYRGYSIRELLKNRQHNCGYEETVFLLLFGYLPDRTEFANFRKSLSDRYDLPADFLTNDILRNPSRNLMNKLQSCTISLYNYAPDPDAQDTYQTLLKGLDLVAKFPSIGCYSYFAKMHHFYRQSLIIHYPRPEYSIA